MWVSSIWNDVLYSFWVNSKPKIVRKKNKKGDLNDAAGFFVCYFFMNADATATNARSRAPAEA